MRTLHASGSLVLLLGFLGTQALRAEDKVEVKIVKYAGLADTVKKFRGKVVVVDLWAEWWIPCKKEFPQLVELHEKYAKQGLAAISVSLDDPKEKGKMDRVIKFLQSRKAAFTNLLLDEDQDFWLKKFKFNGPPCVYVFNRQGKWQRFVDDEDHYPKIEKLVVEWLKE